MIALILTVLTLQRVSGQYLLSIAATTAAATATTARTARDMGVTTIIPVSSTTVKNMFDITETNNVQPREPQKIKLKRQDSTQKQSKSYDVRKSNHHSDFSRVSAAKLQNVNKHNNSQIQFSKLIYNNYKKRKFFNEEQIEVRQQKIIELQQRRRSKRGTAESIVTQLKTNNMESDNNSNRNSKNYRTFKSELSGNSNITTNRYNIKFSVEDSNQKTPSANNQKLLKLVMDGLGLEQLPNMKKINISQREYVTKYREYLRRVHDRKRRELAQLTYAIRNKVEQELESAPLRIVSIAPNVTKYDTYLRQKRNTQTFLNNFPHTKHEVTDAETVSNNFVLPRQQRNNNRKFRQKQTTMILHFALETNAAQLQPGDVEEANIRLMVIHSSALAVKPNKRKQKSKNRSCGSSVEKSGKGHANTTAANDKQKHLLNLKVYQRLGNGKRVCLDSSKVNIEIDHSRKYDTHSQWVQFDVTKAVETWLREERSNLGLEVQCDNCQRVGARILNDMSSPTNVDDVDADGAQLMPILNIIGHLGVSYKEIRSNKHSNSVEKSRHYHNVATFLNGQQRPSGAIDKLSCHKFNQRCCRHTMEVIFKEIKGFEFIIQPKVFDAGYCHGRCPPRYNPAHHHAMLQSLIWKQNRERAPRPCCAPSKLVELEVLHVDEKDSEKLKISTWTDMRVVECACS
uniref:Bone morphogenetic protein 4 n=1 Tax=Bactrocera dorsalis TaxID=27457 RepID=A0A034WCH1_BACDO